MPPQRRIIYIINSLEFGGAEVGMCRLLNGLNLKDKDVTVIALDGQNPILGDQIPPEVSVLDLSLTNTPSLSDFIQFLGLIRDADVVVGSIFHSAIVARAIGFLNPNAMIATWHHNTEFKTNLRKQMFIHTAGFSDVVLADSEPVAELLVDDLGLEKERVHVVPIAGISLEQYDCAKHEGSANIRVGTVGRLSEQKNYGVLLDVAERLKEADITFEIAGDGEMYDEIKAEIGVRDLTNVSVLGSVDDVPSFLVGLDIYFQPSLWEGLCITVLEAMATGLPVVGSDVGGIDRNVEVGSSGFLYKPIDVDGFVSGIEKLASDPQLRERFGKRGREIVAASFTQDVLVEEFERAI